MKLNQRTVLGLSAFFVVCVVFSPGASVHAATANDFSSYVPYTGFDGFGTNMGYYGQQFKDQDVAQLSYNAGSRSIRLSLPDWLITGYGATSRLTAFQFYQTLGLKDLTVFVGEANNPATNSPGGPDDREPTTFPGSDQQALTFKGLYEPIWLDAAKTQINPANTYAQYIYTTVKTYGPYVKFWEIVNEPDLTYGSNGWTDSSSSTSWWNVNPTPDELTNLKAPVFYYIRELRVAYDVIKTLQPSEYVATGGIGYASFLDVLLRNTDNPVDGSVTAQYPLKGGAYFDVLSYHDYPMYSLRHWDNTVVPGGFVYTRYSDSALDAELKQKTDMQADLTKYGYNGTTYPKKQWIVTETDLPQATVGDQWGSPDSARNYIVKAHILGQANGIVQTYKYGLGESDDNSNPIFNTMGVYGDLSPSTTTIANAPKTDEFKAVKTQSDALYGKTYDAAQTAALNLPSTVRGAAFRDSSGMYTYALWATTSVDESEAASATYTFPFSFTGTRREWDYSSTGNATTAGQTVTLNGSPSYFIASANATNITPAPVTNISNVSTAPVNNISFTPLNPIGGINIAPVANAGSDVNVTFSTTTSAAAVLAGSGYDRDGYVARYQWSQISGPAMATILSPNSAATIASNLVPGAYVFSLVVTDNLGATGTDTATVTVSGHGRVSVTAMPRLNVRSAPGAGIIARMPFGSQGLMTDQSTLKGTLWEKVLFDGGTTGWVSAAYLQNL